MDTSLAESFELPDPDITDASGREQWLAAFHAELRRLASRHMAHNRWIATLGTTVLVNESYLRLARPSSRRVTSRQHLLNLASCAMRQIICDYARKRLRERNHVDVDLVFDENEEEQQAAELEQARELVALDEALAELTRQDARKVQVVECRFFAGLSEEETAQALSCSLRTVQREWQAARRWLAEYLEN